MKKLTELQTAANDIGFDKRKISFLVKKAQKEGLAITYGYHEDGEDTWKHGWRSADYKQSDSDVTIFSSTELIIKKKRGARAFTKAATYTAECAIFIFASLSEILKDKEISELFLERKRVKSYEYSASSFARAKKFFADVAAWELLPAETKNKIAELESQPRPSSRARNEQGKKFRTILEEEISALGGRQPLPGYGIEWMTFANSFENLEDYQAAKWAKDLASLVESSLVESD